MALELTTLQDRLIANILSMVPGDARSDKLARAVGSTPASVSSSLLPLRTQGFIASHNDGQQYNYWTATEKLRVALRQRAEQEAREHLARRQAALKEERLAKAQARKAEQPTSILKHPLVSHALSTAQLGKGYAPLPDPKYIVWSPSSSRPPQVQHPTKAKAMEVAALMAQRHPKQVFIVCELQAAALYIPPTQDSGLLRGTL